MGYCSNHRKLTESKDMCEDCLSSSRPDCQEMLKVGFFRWVNEIGTIQSDGEKKIENGELNSMCSCCGMNLNNKLYSPYLLIKPPWGVLDYTQKGDFVTEAGVGDEIEEGDNSDHSKFDWMTDRCLDEDGNEKNTAQEEEEEDDDDEVAENQILSDVDGVVNLKELEIVEEQVLLLKDDSVIFADDLFSTKSMIPLSSIEAASHEINLVNCANLDDHPLIPVEFKENQSDIIIQEVDRGNTGLPLKTQFELVVDSENSVEETASNLVVDEIEVPKFALLESVDIVKDGNEDFSTLHEEERDSIKEVHELVANSNTQTTQTPMKDGNDFQTNATTTEGQRDSDVQSASEEVFHMRRDDMGAEILKGRYISGPERANEVQIPDFLPSLPCIPEDPSTSSTKLHTDDVSEDVFRMSDDTEVRILMKTEMPDQDQTDEVRSSSCLHEDPSTCYANLNADDGSEQAEEGLVEFNNISVEMHERTIDNHLSFCSEFSETEEEKVPYTPTSIEGLHHLHKNLLLEKRELGTEESLDGSAISEFESGEGVSAIEKLKSVLKAERKTLNALYTELEEERSASAVAANQTMAMINRLQEEKAALQMEAFQYQRMMEEQSEYDQEALQMLNDLMVKREKEKQELEEELEVYRKKVMDYEAREEMMMFRRKDGGSVRSRTSSASFSNTEDTDGLYIDVNHDEKEDGGFYGNHDNSNQNTPIDAVLNLEESLVHFEEERLFILEHLKVLEDRLFTTLSDEDEKHFADMKPVEHFYEENSDYIIEVNGIVGNGFSKEMNGKHHEERTTMGSKAKMLLPLFNSIDPSSEDGEYNIHENGFDSVLSQNSSALKSEVESRKLPIEEDVEYVYQRLQALEADREFLKHCISSLKKGEKGIYLLQEILQHLRDLRNVGVRNIAGGVML